MREHKHLRKIRILLDKMYMWQQAGPATTEEEIDFFQERLKKVEAIKELCQEDVNYKLMSQTLKELNQYYKQYNLNLLWTTAN